MKYLLVVGVLVSGFAQAFASYSVSARVFNDDGTLVEAQDENPPPYRCQTTLDCTGGPLIHGQYCDNGICVWED